MRELAVTQVLYRLNWFSYVTSYVQVTRNARTTFCLDQIQWKTEKQCLWLANLVYVPINERPKVQEKLLLKEEI